VSTWKLVVCLDLGEVSEAQKAVLKTEFLAALRDAVRRSSSIGCTVEPDAVQATGLHYILNGLVQLDAQFFAHHRLDAEDEQPARHVICEFAMLLREELTLRGAYSFLAQHGEKLGELCV